MNNFTFVSLFKEVYDINLFKTSFFMFLLTVIIFFIAGCSTEISVRPNEDMPDDFNFSLTYGSYGKQKIDTFKDLVVKDLVEDGTIEARIALSEEEMKQIYNEMMNINVMGELELDLDKDEECHTEPPRISIWDIQMDGKTKSFNYQSYCDYPEDVLNLLKLEEYIHNIVSIKTEYKALPESRGAYE
jgi:hypothetical protein